MDARGIVAIVALALAAPSWAGTQTRTSAFEYDPNSGQLIREIIEPDNSGLCQVTTYVYDAYGNRTSTTTRNCNGTSSGGVTEAAAPTADPVFATRTSTAAYAAGSVVIGGVTYNWSAGQFATTSTNALSQSESRTFDPRFGGVASLTGPNALTTSWTYDSFGRKSTETLADTTVTSWFYERCADIAGACPSFGTPLYRVRVTTTGAPTTSTYYDSLNRELRTETQGFDGTLIYKDTQYDSLGRVAQVSRPYYAGATPVWTVFTSYDLLGRVTQVNEPSTSAGMTRTLTTYNNPNPSIPNAWDTIVTVNNSGTATNMPGGVVQTKTTTKNSQGQAIKITDAQGSTVTYAYSYDASGNLTTTTTDTLGNVTTLKQDLRGRKTQMIDPDMGTWAYFYDALGQLIRQTDAKNQTSTIAYDLLGRVTSRTEPDLVSSWTYDSCTKGVGKLCQASATNGYSRTNTYDSLGRPSTLTVTVDTSYTVTTAYVLSGIHVGKVDTVTYPTGFAVRNNYNAYGYLLSVQRADAGGSTVFWTANTKDASGRVTSELLGNSLTQTRSYDPVDRLTSVVASGAAGTVHNFGYTYDTVGNVLTRADNVDAVTENFSYDSINRLLMASGTGLITRSFNYDAIGNMTSKSDAGTYTYPASGSGSAHPHAVSSVSGTVNSTYSYDANGNLISGGGRTLTYMSFNMPATITGSAATYTYTYNPEHERVKLITSLATGTQTSIYLHPGGAGALFYEKEIKPDATIENKHYVQAGSALIGVYVTKSSYQSGDGPQMRYYHRDSLGSIMAISNEAGAVMERLAYEAYGHRRYPSGTADPSCGLFGITTDRGFTAHEHLDELCLVHMNGRVYDPTLGRFMTADPYIQSPDNLQSYNRYSYVVNNPLGYTDPTGYHHHWKHQIAHITQNIMKVAGSNKYLGGLFQMGLLTYSGFCGPACSFGAAYGWSTGDWKTVGRAYATMTIMAASAGVGELTWGAYGSAISIVSSSAATAYASSYAAAYVNGASSEEARRMALLSAKRDAVMAGFRVGYQALVGYDSTPAPGENRSGDDPNRQVYTPDKSGRLPPEVRRMNIIGFNERLNGTYWQDTLRQGGDISKILNLVPGINAIGGLDDYLNNVANLLGPSARLGDSVWFKLLTIPTSVVVTVPALLEQVPLSVNAFARYNTGTP